MYVYVRACIYIPFPIYKVFWGLFNEDNIKGYMNSKYLRIFWKTFQKRNDEAMPYQILEHTKSPL